MNLPLRFSAEPHQHDLNQLLFPGAPGRRSLSMGSPGGLRALLDYQLAITSSGQDTELQEVCLSPALIMLRGWTLSLVLYSRFPAPLVSHLLTLYKQKLEVGFEEPVSRKEAFAGGNGEHTSADLALRFREMLWRNVSPGWPNRRVEFGGGGRRVNGTASHCRLMNLNLSCKHGASWEVFRW